VNQSALLAGKNNLVSATPAEIPKLILLIQPLQFCPDCLVENVVVFDQLALLSFACQFCGKPCPKQLLEGVFVHFGKNVELLRLSQVKEMAAASAASRAAWQCAAHE
jgi:hypothetical protein